MSVRARIAAIRLIEKMELDKAYSEKLGLSDESKLHGKEISKERRIGKDD